MAANIQIILLRKYFKTLKNYIIFIQLYLFYIYFFYLKKLNN